MTQTIKDTGHQVRHDGKLIPWDDRYDIWADIVWDCQGACIREVYDFKANELCALKTIIDEEITKRIKNNTLNSGADMSVTAHKTPTTYMDEDSGEINISDKEYLEVGIEGEDLYIHVQKDIGFAIGLIFTAKELQKIADDIAKVLKAYGRL